MEQTIQTAKSSRIRVKTVGPNDMPRYAQYILIAILALLSLACILPMFLVLAVSISDEVYISQAGYQFFPKELSLYAYEYLFYDYKKILNGYWISFLITAIGTASSLVVTSLFAYPVSRPDFPYRNQFLFFVFFTMLFNGGLVPWYLIYAQAGLKDTLFALLIPYLVIPFNLIIMRTFFGSTIPHALIESAKIDGAGELRIYWQIVLPLSLPVMATIGLFQMLRYWNDWYLSLIYINQESLVNIQYLLYRVISNINYLNSGLANQVATDGILAALPTQTVRMAIAVIGIGPIVFVYPFIQKYFVKGLTVGSVKG
ncbi:carbohydrate ABC transporter permease [Paenibacillus sp. GCM10023252]|uniref:carbohydrate ABC transporter permease n=1 Tax=Paenibacillus sp. GCM10023252 TaxID=3252649 RepID=UPI0036088ABB